MAPYPRTRGANGESSTTIVSASNDGVLPRDVLYEILLRLPAKALCRLRTVCRSWRSLLSDDPSFIAAHTVWHPDPVLAIAARDDDGTIAHVDILDMLGNLIKRVRTGTRCSAYDTCTDGDLVCMVCEERFPRLHVLDAATGLCFALPNHDPDHHIFLHYSFTLGRAASSGVYKVLHVTMLRQSKQVFRVLTVGSNGGHRWRKTGSAPATVGRLISDVAVVNGVVFFLVDLVNSPTVDDEFRDWIVAFDLETEAWRPTCLRGPRLSVDMPMHRVVVRLANLNDCLVAVCDNLDAAMELWFLVDSNKVLWTKQYRITMPYHDRPRSCPEFYAMPLWVLDDGRILFWLSSGSALRMYDPRTKTSTDVTLTPNCNLVGVYTGSMLSRGILCNNSCL